MNGQHLRALPFEELSKIIGERWKSTGLLTESEGPFIDVSFFVTLIFLHFLNIMHHMIMMTMVCKYAPTGGSSAA